MVPHVNAESKSAKKQINFPYVWWGGGGGSGDQLPTFDAESKSAKILYSLC